MNEYDMLRHWSHYVHSGMRSWKPDQYGAGSGLLPQMIWNRRRSAAYGAAESYPAAATMSASTLESSSAATRSAASDP